MLYSKCKTVLHYRIFFWIYVSYNDIWHGHIVHITPHIRITCMETLRFTNRRVGFTSLLISVTTNITSYMLCKVKKMLLNWIKGIDHQNMSITYILFNSKTKTKIHTLYILTLLNHKHNDYVTAWVNNNKCQVYRNPSK